MPDGRSPGLTEEAVEMAARALLREVIERSGWYPNLKGEERQKRIEADVDLNWHLMVHDARKRLTEVPPHTST